MKKVFTLLLIIFSFAFATNAQLSDPVKWEYTAKKIADKTYEVHLTAKIDKGWHIYSQQAGEGPVSTSFTFSRNPILILQGKTKEIGKVTKEYDNAFGSILSFYSGKVDFVQIVKLRTPAKTLLKGELEFMVCNEQKCLPPKTIPFSIKVGDK